MFHRTRAARPLATAIGVALSLTLLAPAGLSPATAAPADAQPTVQTQNVTSFSDVSSRHVFYREISWMGSAGISNGWTMQDGTRQYRPAQRVLRDQMAAFMYRLAGSPTYTPPKVSPFTDVRPGQAFYKEITWLAENGISTGWAGPNDTRTFGPGRPVMRDQMAAFMYRLAGSPNYTAPSVSKFTDVRPGKTFYKEISWLAENGISTGWASTGGTRIYGPGREVMRDQMAAFMYRLHDGGHLDHFTANQPLKLVSTGVKPGEVNVPVNWTLTATGGTKPYTFARVAGTLPGDIYLSSTGKFTGTPTRSGEYEIAVKVTDARGNSVTTPVILSVVPRDLSQKTALTAKSMDANYINTAVVQNDGTVWEWTADQSRSGFLTPTKREGISNIIQTATGAESTLALRADGTVWGWGWNMYGELANPDAGGLAEMPVRVGGLTNVVQIASAGRTNFALKSDGTIWSWGSNWNYLLGTGQWQDNPPVKTPVRVPNLANAPIASIEAGEESVYAVTRDGSVWAWGMNFEGQLGLGHTDSASSPRPVPGLTGVKSVAAGSSGAYAVKTNGTVWHMGQRDCAIHPSGAPKFSTTAQQVYNLTGVTSMSVGACSSFAVKADGTLTVSGQAINGADLGTGTTYEPNFVPVPGLPSVAKVTANAGIAGERRASAYAIGTDGSLWGWGFQGPYHSRDGGDGLVHTPTRLTR
ncbi:S-layer homology domain-containing protein [Kocuria sp. CPCC 205258]|uniref:RCC1 domain-containing protein n=1 Tax=Kocuria sp. CPCC 205258 TaxID=3073552 RepID=UPI0034D5FBC4